VDTVTVTATDPAAGVTRIISNGESGAARGALDAAIGLGIEHGGWCVKGRGAEDGLVPERYQLEESFSPTPAVAVQRNVVDADGTAVFAVSEGGEQGADGVDARRFCRQRARPVRVVDLGRAAEEAPRFRDWLDEHRIATLHIAGPTEGASPGLAERVRAFLVAALSARE
jgi:hypothetical protein